MAKRTKSRVGGKKRTSSKSRSSARHQKQSYETLHDLLILKIRALYDVEKQLVKALPKMAKAASDKELKGAFDSHLQETRGQVERLEEAARALDFKITLEESDAIRGLIKDAEWCIKNIKDSKALDASLIAAAQYVEHFEMAGYGAARTWAKEMGHQRVAELLQATLDEEGAANDKLTAIAEGGVNEEANDMHEDAQEESLRSDDHVRVSGAIR